MIRPFEPMLAGKADAHTYNSFPVLASPKLDGVRAVNKSGLLLSRSLKLIPNKFVQTTLCIPAFDGLDGELTVGPANAPNVMQATTSVVMSHNKAETFAFHVFDLHNHSAGFMERFERLKEQIKPFQDNWADIAHTYSNDPFFFASPICPVHLVPHTLIESAEQLNIYEAEQLALGYEGVMLRSLSGAYKHGRSTAREGGLLKVKRFSDAEAVVIDFEEEMENTNPQVVNEKGRSKRSSHKGGKVGKGTLGALTVRLRLPGGALGVQFSIGSGLNEATANAIWAQRDHYMGKIVKFKHFEHGVVDAPRHPVFIGWRDEKDL